MPDSLTEPAAPRSIDQSRLSGLFGTGDDFLDSISPDRRETVKSRLATLPDAGAERQRLANTVFLADRFNLSAREVADRYDTLRNSYAKQRFGVDTMDDGVFFTNAGRELKERANDAATQVKLGNMLFESAVAGEDFGTAFEKMRNTGEIPGDKRRADLVNAWAIDRWEKTRTTAAAMRPAVDAATELFAAVKGGGLGTADAAIEQREHVADLLATLGPEERAAALSIAARRAETLKGQEIGAVMATVRTLGEGTDDLLSAALSGLYNTAEATVGHTEAEKRRQERFQVGRQLDRVMSGEVDPIEGDSFAGQVALDFTRSVPTMLAALTGPGLALDYFALKQNARERLEAQGMEGDVAERLATVQAIPQTALFFAQSKMVFLGRTPAAFGKDIATTLGVEAVGNFAINEAGFLTDAGIQQLASTFSDAVPEVDWQQFGQSFKDRLPQSMALAIPGALIGTGVATFRNRPAGERYLKQPEVMDDLGFTPEAKEAVTAAPDYLSAEKAFKDGFEQRNPIANKPVESSAVPVSTESSNIVRNQDGTYRVQAVEGAPAVTAATPEGAAMVAQAQRTEAAQQAATSPPVPRPEVDGRALPPRITALNKESIAALRALFNMDELDAPTRERFVQVLDEAKRTEATKGADELAADLIATGRVSSAAEHAALVLRSAELQNAYEQKAQEIGDAYAAGDTDRAAGLRVVADNILQQLDTLTEASDKSGTAIARALSIRRMRVNRDDYSLARVVQRARAVKQGELTAEQQAKFKQFADEIAAQQATIAEQKAKLDAQALELAKAQAETFVAEGRSRRRAAAAKDAGARRASLKKELLALGMRVNDITGIIGNNVEMARIVAKIADTYIEEGVASLQELTNKLKADIPDLSDQDVFMAVGRQTKKQAAKITDEAKQRVRELRQQASLWAKINAALENRRPDGSPLNRTQRNKLLRETLAELRRQANRTTFDDAALRRVDAKIAELQKHLAQGTRPTPERPAGEPSEKLSAAKKTLSELRQEMGALDTIEELERSLAEAEPKPGNAGQPAPKPTPTEQQAKLTAMRDRIADLRDAIDHAELDPAAVNAERLAKLQRLSAELETQLEQGFRPIPEPKRTIADTDEVAAARRQLHELERIMRTADSIADLEEQIRTGDYRVSAREERILTNERLERAMIRERQLKRQVDALIEEARPKGITDRINEGFQLSRALVTTADMGAILRQGLLLSASRPVTAARTFVASLRALLNENTADAIALAIENRPHAMEGIRAKLYLSDTGAAPNAREEHFQSNLAERIPGWGRVVRASNRSMVTTLNLLRVAAFDSFIEAHPEATAVQKRAYAEYVNAASGRGNVKWSPSTVKWLNAVFFAPRYTVSRFQALYSPIKNVRDPIVRNAILKDFGALAGTGLSVLGLAALAGAEVSLDPSESDFGKIVIGDTRIDIWGGLQQPMRLMLQAALMGPQQAEVVELEKDIDALEAASQFLKYKLSPAITLPSALLSGENIIGQEQGAGESIVRAVTPLGVQEAVDVGVANEDIAAGLAAYGAGFLGLGIQQHNK